MISFKKLLNKLEENGYNSYRLKQSNLIGQRTFYALKNGDGNVDWKTMNKLCEFFNCQVGDLCEYIPDDDASENKD